MVCVFSSFQALETHSHVEACCLVIHEGIQASPQQPQTSQSITGAVTMETLSLVYRLGVGVVVGVFKQELGFFKQLCSRGNLKGMKRSKMFE